MIGFGLVSIPVALEPATSTHDVPLRLVHAEDAGPIRYRRVCQTCGQEVPYSGIARGYTDHAGHRAILTDADMEQLPLPSKRLIDVLAFVDAASIDPLRLGRAYYVTAQSQASAGAVKPYVLLRDALAEAGQAAVAKVAIGTRERLALLRVHRDTLVLHQLYWPDEVRPADVPRPDPEVTVHPGEVAMAVSLMEAMSAGFDLAGQHDDYAAALRQLAESKIEHLPAPEVPQPAAAETETLDDLMAALKASIAQHQPQEPGQPGKGGA